MHAIRYLSACEGRSSVVTRYSPWAFPKLSPRGFLARTCFQLGSECLTVEVLFNRSLLLQGKGVHVMERQPGIQPRIYLISTAAVEMNKRL